MTITAKEGSNFTGTITCKYSIAEKDKDDTGNNGDKNKDDTKKDDTKKDDTKKDDTKNKDDNKKQVKNTQNNKDNQNKSTTKQVSKDQKETAVKTGDTAHAFGYLLALEGALVVSLATLLISRKRRHR